MIWKTPALDHGEFALARKLRTKLSPGKQTEHRRHSGLAATIRAIRRRISTAVTGRPRRRRLTLDRRVQKLAETLPLPPEDRVRPYVGQGSAPAVPGKGQPNPKQQVKGTQHRSLMFPLEGCELKAESAILHRNASMTAYQESNESKNRQKEA
jgi:hypothetical protein